MGHFTKHDSMSAWLLPTVKVGDTQYVAFKVENSKGEHDARFANPPYDHNLECIPEPIFRAGQPWAHVPTMIVPAFIKRSEFFEALAPEWPGLQPHDATGVRFLGFDTQGRLSAFVNDGVPLNVMLVGLDLGERDALPDLTPTSAVAAAKPLVWVDVNDITQVPYAKLGDGIRGEMALRPIVGPEQQSCIANIAGFGNIAIQGDVSAGFEKFFKFLFPKPGATAALQQTLAGLGAPASPYAPTPKLE